MYKVFFKLYDSNKDATDDNARGCSVYPTTYTSLVCAQRMLRSAFGVYARKHREKIPYGIGDHNVIESYFVKNFDDGISARFYIIEEDD